MPRKRTIYINISDLKCYDLIKDELNRQNRLQNYEIDKATISIKEYVAPKIRQDKLKKAITAIKNNPRFNSTDKKSKHVSKRSDIARITGISRQTIARWCRIGFIEHTAPTYQDYRWHYDLEGILKDFEEIYEIQKNQMRNN